MLGQDLCVVMGRSGGTSPSMRQTVVTVANGYEEEEVGELIVEDGVSEENELVESGLTNNCLTATEFCAKLEVVMGNIISCGSSFQIV